MRLDTFRAANKNVASSRHVDVDGALRTKEAACKKSPKTPSVG